MKSAKELANIAYCAGIIDGEGSIFITKRHRNGGVRYEGVVSVRMTEPGPLYKLAEVFGGEVNYYTHTDPPCHKPYYHWTRFGARGAEILREVYPFLEAKWKQADNIFAFRKLISNKNIGYTLTPTQLKKREALYLKARKLNG